MPLSFVEYKTAKVMAFVEKKNSEVLNIILGICKSNFSKSKVLINYYFLFLYFTRKLRILVYVFFSPFFNGKVFLFSII